MIIAEFFKVLEQTLGIKQNAEVNREFSLEFVLKLSFSHPEKNNRTC